DPGASRRLPCLIAGGPECRDLPPERLPRAGQLGLQREDVSGGFLSVARDGDVVVAARPPACTGQLDAEPVDTRPPDKADHKEVGDDKPGTVDRAYEESFHQDYPRCMQSHAPLVEAGGEGGGPDQCGRGSSEQTARPALELPVRGPGRRMLDSRSSW